MKRFQSSLLALFGLLACSPDGPSVPPTPARRDNVLLVTIDTLRADHLSCYGYPRATTPNLDRLAREGVRFAGLSTPRAKTSPALASLFTGAYPHEHGVRDLLQPIGAERALLAETLRDAGYQTAAIVGNFVLQRRHCGFERGFAHYVDQLSSRQGVPPHDAPQRGARSLTEAALVALKLGPAPALDEDGQAFQPPAALLDPARPWFLWLHYMDPHGTYEPAAEDRVFQREAPRWIAPPPADAAPARRRAQRVAEYNVPAGARDDQGRFDADAVIDLYDGEIRGVDRELGRLLEALRARGDLAHTWIVVSSDHGESLGEHDYWFEHGFYAYQSTAAVPLIVRPPDGWEGAGRGRPAPGVRAGALSLADLGPTLGDWLGVATPRGTSPVSGASRAALLWQDDPALFATYGEKIEAAELTGTAQIKSVRLGDWKLYRRWAHAPPKVPGEAKRLVLLGEELFDLAGDPLEARDLARAPPPNAPLDALRLALLEFGACDAPFVELEQLMARRRAALEANDAPALRELKALGY